ALAVELALVADVERDGAADDGEQQQRDEVGRGMATAAPVVPVVPAARAMAGLEPRNARAAPRRRRGEHGAASSTAAGHGPWCLPQGAGREGRVGVWLRPEDALCASAHT